VGGENSVEVGKMEVLYSLKDKRRGITLPQINEKLAEETGIHIGDGSMSYQKKGYRLVYAGNLFEDASYMRFVRLLLKELYNIDSSIKEIRKHTLVYIRIFSKAICTFKNTFLGLPFGKKSKSIDIPLVFQSDLKLAKACIRGIFDTDGGVVFQKQGKYCYPAVILVNKSKFLVHTLMELLAKLGFTPYVEFDSTTQCSRIWVKGNQQFEKWFKTIGSSNERNLKKYHWWLNWWGRQDLNSRGQAFARPSRVCGSLWSTAPMGHHPFVSRPTQSTGARL
jgi:hypothetical protein